MLLDAAAKAGADAADALVAESQGVSVALHDGVLDQAERAESIDLGLRVLVGQRQACVVASDPRPATIETLATRAMTMAREAPEDTWIGLAAPDELGDRRNADGLELCDNGAPPDPAALQDIAVRAADGARSVEGVSKVSDSEAGYSSTSIHLAASNGFSGGYTRTGGSAYVTAISGDGTEMERDYFGESRVFWADLPEAEDIGREAGKRTVERTGARKPPTGSFPVLYDERISSSLIGHLAAAVNGQSVARGSSWATDLSGEQILPRGLSLIEDPLRPRVAGSRPFDGEGLKTAQRTLVDDGVLTGWTLDLATARQLGLSSTASAGRGVGSPPSPVTGNLDLTPGRRSREDLIQEMGTGLIITSMIGASINPTTGHYSRGASGFWVENGEITGPVNECTVAGNLRDMLRSIIPANDARAHLSRRVPSFLVEGLTIAGG